jgi:competence protein ComEA
VFKKFVLACIAFVLTMGLAFAQVEANKADQAALDGVKGIGPTLSKAIIAERTKGGDFKDWADFQKRVKGVGDKNSAKLSQAGLQVNGQSKPGVAAPAVASAPATAYPAAVSATSAASAPTK